MTSSHPIAATCQWFSQLARPLDRRSAPRLALLFLGAVLARGRRTITSWIRASGLSDQYQPCYIAVAAAGKKADSVAARLVTESVKPLVAAADRLTLALDDTPTKRYGPHVQGAGIRHNPAPGPAGSPYVYGHELDRLARQSGLDRDRFAGLALQAAQQAAEHQSGIRPLLDPAEAGQVATEEGGEPIPAAADLLRAQDGVGKEGLGLGMVQERHGGASVRYPRPPA